MTGIIHAVQRFFGAIFPPPRGAPFPVPFSLSLSSSSSHFSLSATSGTSSDIRAVFFPSTGLWEERGHNVFSATSGGDDGGSGGRPRRTREAHLLRIVGSFETRPASDDDLRQLLREADVYRREIERTLDHLLTSASAAPSEKSERIIEEFRTACLYIRRRLKQLSQLKQDRPEEQNVVLAFGDGLRDEGRIETPLVDRLVLLDYLEYVVTRFMNALELSYAQPKDSPPPQTRWQGFVRRGIQRLEEQGGFTEVPREDVMLEIWNAWKRLGLKEDHFLQHVVWRILEGERNVRFAFMPRYATGDLHVLRASQPYITDAERHRQIDLACDAYSQASRFWKREGGVTQFASPYGYLKKRKRVAQMIPVLQTIRAGREQHMSWGELARHDLYALLKFLDQPGPRLVPVSQAYAIMQHLLRGRTPLHSLPPPEDDDDLPE